MTLMGPYTTEESCGVECKPITSRVGLITIWVKKKENLIRYIPDSGKGWTRVKFEGGGNKGLELYVPQGLKVRLDKTEKGRDYYTFLEGWNPKNAGQPLKGVQASNGLNKGKSILHTKSPLLKITCIFKT